PRSARNPRRAGGRHCLPRPPPPPSRVASPIGDLPAVARQLWQVCLELGEKPRPHQGRLAAARAADHREKTFRLETFQELQRLLVAAEKEHGLIAFERSQADERISPAHARSRTPNAQLLEERREGRGLEGAVLIDKEREPVEVQKQLETLVDLQVFITRLGQVDAKELERAGGIEDRLDRLGEA